MKTTLVHEMQDRHGNNCQVFEQSSKWISQFVIKYKDAKMYWGKRNGGGLRTFKALSSAKKAIEKN